MLDIRFLRENPEIVRENIKKKFQEAKLPLVDKALELDARNRTIKMEVEALRAERNKASKQIGALMAQKKREEAEALKKEIAGKGARIDALTAEEKQVEEDLRQVMLVIPNVIDDSVPIGKDDSENVELERFGEPAVPDYEIPYHADIMESFEGLDLDTAGRVAGNGFYYLKGDIARLHSAVLAYARDFMIGKFIDQTLKEEDLPYTLTSYSPCFRKEKGAHGIEERGVYRIHQFEKQEMVVVCRPEESMDWFARMWQYTVELFRSLNIPVRTLECCSGDLADLKVKSVDVEAWSPRQKKYFEVGSCSNLGDAQARRLKIRVQAEDGSKYLAHTLNNTVVAPPRMLIAFLENNIRADGSVAIPAALRPYMGGQTELKKA